jgi:uncharacterized protein (DUF1697 family)
MLFRGINVGGRNLLPMKELVSLLDTNTYRNIRTYIQSGNLVLQSHEKPENIALLIHDRFGFEPEVFVFEEPEFSAAVEKNPYASGDGKHVHFFFCNEQPEINIEKLERLKSDSEQYHVNGRVCYFFAPEGIGRSKLAANMESCLGVSATGRNLNTVRKLKEMAMDVSDN